MATSPISSSSIYVVLIFTLTAIVPHATARPSTALQWREIAKNQNVNIIPRNNHALVMTSKILMAEEEVDAAGVIRSTPARPMPEYKQSSAPTPLPEFPTLGPPIVWSFPATPLPALEAPPPDDMPPLPRSGSKKVAPPPACVWGDHHRPRIPPSVPYVAAEPANFPGPLEAPEGAPEPTAGGPLLPPYH